MRLAIKYEKELKNEIVKFLSDIGGKDRLVSFQDGDYCYIDIAGQICSIKDWNARLKKDFCKFTYSELMERFPYSPGDRVILNESIRLGDERCDTGTIDTMFWDGQIQEVRYIVKFDTGKVGSDEYGALDLEPAVKEVVINMPLNEFFVQSGKITVVNIQDQNYSDEVEIVLNDSYELRERCGKWFAIKKKVIFPKTYEKCCSVLGKSPGFSIVIDEDDKLYKSFIQLKRCRDAYWKLLGNWKPDYDENSELKYIISYLGDEINLDVTYNFNYFLIFPTEELRNSFYENFKDLIEDCKELL